MFDAFVKKVIIFALRLWHGFDPSHSHKLASDNHDPDNVDERSILGQRLQGVTDRGQPGNTRERPRTCTKIRHHDARPLRPDIAPVLCAKKEATQKYAASEN